jgi:hypothetical protein
VRKGLFISLVAGFARTVPQHAKAVRDAPIGACAACGRRIEAVHGRKKAVESAPLPT